MDIGVPGAVWAVTTPFMPDKTTGNFAVEEQNAIAARIMTAENIPSVDLYSRVTAKCGELYTNCSICDDESRFNGVEGERVLLEHFKNN